MVELNKKIIDVDSVKPYRSPQQKKQRVIALVVVFIVAALGGSAYLFLVPKKEVYTLKSFETAVVQLSNLVQTTQASGTVSIPVQMNLLSPEAGYAAKLFVNEGDAVIRDQVLAQIDVPDLQDSLEDLQSSLAEARFSLERARAQNRISIGRKEREIVSLGDDITEAEEERDRVKALVKINSSRQSELDAAQKSLDELIDNKREKELQLEEDKELNSMDEKAMEANITNLETKIERVLEKIEATSITSPMNGEVLEIESSLAVPGSSITANKTLFVIADPKSAIVELEVLEQYAAALNLGQEVGLTVGTNSITGSIISIGKVAQQSSDGLGATVSVKVKPGESAEPFLLGSTAVGVLELGIKQDVLLLPRGPYLTTGSQRYLYKVEDNKARRVEVTFGDVQGTEVEIIYSIDSIDGVKAGDEIIISGYQNYIEYEEVELKD